MALSKLDAQFRPQVNQPIADREPGRQNQGAVRMRLSALEVCHCAGEIDQPHIVVVGQYGRQIECISLFEQPSEPLPSRAHSERLKIPRYRARWDSIGSPCSDCSDDPRGEAYLGSPCSSVLVPVPNRNDAWRSSREATVRWRRKP